MLCVVAPRVAGASARTVPCSGRAAAAPTSSLKAVDSGGAAFLRSPCNREALWTGGSLHKMNLQESNNLLKHGNQHGVTSSKPPWYLCNGTQRCQTA